MKKVFDPCNKWFYYRYFLSNDSKEISMFRNSFNKDDHTSELIM